MTYQYCWYCLMENFTRVPELRIVIAIGLAVHPGEEDALVPRHSGEAMRSRWPQRRGLSRACLLRLLGKQEQKRTEKADAFKSQACFANSTGRCPFIEPSHINGPTMDHCDEQSEVLFVFTEDAADNQPPPATSPPPTATPLPHLTESADQAFWSGFYTLDPPHALMGVLTDLHIHRFLLHQQPKIS